MNSRPIILSCGDQALLAMLTDVPLTPIDIGRALHRMEAEGLASSADARDTCNDLARAFVRH